MSQESITNSKWTYHDIIKAIPSIAVGVTSALYILGLIIANLYFAEYGISDKELLRTNYLLSGAIFVVLVVVAEICFSYFIDWKNDLKFSWHKKEYAKVFGSPIALFFVVISIPGILSSISGRSNITFSSLLAPTSGVLLVSGALYVAFLNFRKIFLKLKLEGIESNLQAKLHEQLSEILLPFVFIFFSLAAYANTTYPFISAAYGGGYRAPAIIYPSQRGMEFFKSIALPINANQTIGPVEILSESEKELTILIPNGFSEQKIAIQINKDLLDAIQTKTKSSM